MGRPRRRLRDQRRSDVPGPLPALGTLRELFRAIVDEPPDLILLETMSLIRDGVTMPAVETALATGLPVWLSFRRCRRGACGIYGQHWGGPEGDRFGRAARRFEALGVGALLINCLPTDHVPGMLPWLRDFTDLPLGVSRTSGTGRPPAGGSTTRLARGVRGARRSRGGRKGRRSWAAAAARRPQHIAAARTRVAGTHRAGRDRGGRARRRGMREWAPTDAPAPPRGPTRRGRSPVSPSISGPRARAGRVPADQGSLLVWSYLFSSGLGRDKSCIDVGCGSGVQAIQLALNGATSVYAVDVEPTGDRHTMANAYRNGVAERVTADSTCTTWCRIGGSTSSSPACTRCRSIRSRRAMTRGPGITGAATWSTTCCVFCRDCSSRGGAPT